MTKHAKRYIVSAMIMLVYIMANAWQDLSYWLPVALDRFYDWTMHTQEGGLVMGCIGLVIVAVAYVSCCEYFDKRSD